MNYQKQNEEHQDLEVLEEDKTFNCRNCVYLRMDRKIQFPDGSFNYGCDNSIVNMGSFSPFSIKNKKELLKKVCRQYKSVDEAQQDLFGE